MAKIPPPPHAVRLILDTGLALPEERAQTVALARYGHRLLAARDAEGNDAFVALLHAVAERSTARHRPPQPLACGKGCSFCCRAHVSLLAPEAFALARVLRGKARFAAVPARLAASAEASRTLDLAARRAAGLACALLVDDLCSVYAARPLTCRMFASFSLTACETAAAGGADAVPQPGEFHTVRSLVAMAGYAAMHAAGMPLVAYELSQTLERLLAEPDLERRYHAGEDALAAADGTCDALDAGFVRAVERLAADAGLAISA